MPEITCPECGCSLPEQPSEGLCPVCILTGVLARGLEEEPPPPVEDPAALKRCGAYEILGLLARGGMGVVLRAKKAGLSREVALKMIANADLAAPDEVRRFRLEAELIAQLDHPNIVPVYDLGEHEGRPFFVMKLAEGGTLSQRLPLAGGPTEAVSLLVKVARAVHFAHDHGVLHRDLKPANILLDAGGEPLVSDFGLARLAHSPLASFGTGTGVGTPAYMAPEQAQGSHAVTMASDVYGLGAVLYHLVTDKAPFSGPTPLAILRQAETVEPKDPRELKPTLDRDLATICLKCLEKNPGKRYRSAAALADDLERWQRGEPVVARPATWTERLWKWTKRHPAKAALYFTASIGTAVLAVVLAVGNVLLREEKEYAQAKEADARRGTARAEASEEAMRQNVYAADLFLARRALEDGHLGVAREMLARHQPAEGVKDLRGYEWYALERQCQGDDVRELTGHAAPALAVAWSPDGKRVATGGGDGSLKIWQANDALLEKDLPDQPKLSKLGELGLLATLPLRSPEAAELLAPGSGVSVDEIRMRARPSSLGEVSVLAWSPDGGMLATAGLGSYVRLWKTTDWSFQGFLPIKTCTQLAFTKEGQLIVALSASVATNGGSEVRMYDVATLQRQQTWSDVVPCFALAQNVGWLAVAKHDGVVEIVELATSSVRHTLKLNDGITTLTIAANGERLAALHRHTGTLWQVVEHRLVAGFSSAGEGFQCLAMTSDGEKFAASGAGHVIQLFSGQDGASLWSMRGHDDELLAMSFAPDGRLLASSSNDHTARLWSAEQPHHQALEISERGKLVASDVSGNALLAERDGAVRCWDAQGKLLGATPSNAPRVALAFDLQKGNFATLQEKSGTLEWWKQDASQVGEAVKVPVVAGGFHAESAARGWIAISGAKGPVQLFDWHQGELLKEFPGPSFKITRMVASPDGRWIVAVQWPRTLALLDTESGKWNEQHKLTVGTVGPIVFSPDGRFLATSGSDNLVSVWDPLTWNLLAALRGHKTEVKALGFTVDGRTLASSSSDGTVHLWHSPTWRELGVLHRGPLCSGLLFTPRELVAEEYVSRWILLPGQEK